jgi:protein SCO1/2
MSDAAISTPATAGEKTAAASGATNLPRRLAWALFALALLALPLAAQFLRPADRLPVLGVLPPFSLTDQDARSFSRKDLDGKVWVADFVFIRCNAVCPLLTQKMRSLKTRLSKEGRTAEVGLVSLSVDPEHDTPERLKQYAQRFGADSADWRFLTGPVEGVQKTIVDGFKISMGRVPLKEGATEPSDFEIVHGQKFVLVDRKGQIRGYYDVDLPEGIDRLAGDVALLVGSAP